MRRTLLAAATACAVLAFVSCSDDTAGPRAPIAGQLAIVPSFGTLQGGIVEIARGRFVLTRIPGGEVAKDTIIDIPPDADSVDLSLSVPVFGPGETLNLTISLITDAGDTVFRGGPLEVTPGTSGTPVPIEVPFTYVGTGADAAAVRILTPDTTTLTGDSVLLTAQAEDGGAAAIPNTPIGWESLDTAVVRIVGRDAQYRGRAVGGTQRGIARIVAMLVTDQRDTMLISNQPLPTAIVAESGSNQSARADSTLPLPLVARVTAGDGQGVAGLWVRFAETSGGGSVSADSVLTDATGRAAVQYTMARSFVPHVITASTARLTPTAAFNATLVFEPAATLEIVTGNGQTATAGSAVTVAPQVRVLDADGLSVPGVAVTFSVTGGAGIVAGGTPVTDNGGLAAVSSWTLGTTAGSNTLQATVSGLPPVTFTATGVAGAATQLTLVSGNAQTGQVGTALALPLVVRATDSNGNPAPGGTVNWTTGLGSLSAASTITDDAGLAQVLWTLGTAPVAHAAAAALGGTSATVDFTATAISGNATRLAFTVQPSNGMADAAITPAVEVTAYDVFDNLATGFTGPVQVALLANPGGATLGGSTTTAAVAGVASFADLTVSAAGTGYTLQATATGLASATSAAFTMAPPSGQVAWINPSGGAWGTGSNWSTGGPPAATDTALITLAGTYVVQLDQSTTVQRLVVGAATGVQTFQQTANALTVTDGAVFGANSAYQVSGGSFAGAFSNAGTMIWSGGTLVGPSSLTNSGTLTLSTASTKTLDAAATLTNTGTLFHVGSGSLVLGLGAIVTNGPGALLDFQSDADIDWVSGTSPEPFVTNQGTIRKSTGTGQSFIDQLQNLGGTLDVQSGELELRSYDGTSNASTGGTFTVAGGATLDLTSEQDAAHDEGIYQGTYTGSGGGTVLLDNGVLHVGTGATFNFPGTMLQWQAGTITDGAFTNANAMTWSGGTLAASASLANPGTLTLAGAGSMTLAAGAAVTNTGTVLHTGAGSLVLSIGAVVTNGPSALYEIQSDADIDWVSGTSPEPFVRNQGTMRKSAGTGQSFIDQLELLGGTLDVQTGELELRSYDGTTNTSTGGTLLVAPAATLDLTSEQDAAHDEGTYQGTYTGSGGGTVLLDNGVLHVGTGVTFNLPSAMLQWQAGTIADGSLTNAGTLTLPGTATKTLAGGATLSNQGTLAVEAGTLVVSGTFSHAAGAVLQGSGILDLSSATVAAFDGEVRPGTSPGLLTIAAPAGLALGGTASITVELGGSTLAGADFDQMRVTNQLLTLGGTLNVALIDPYLPSGGESWPILAGVTGSFATVNLPPGIGDTATRNDTLFLGQPVGGGPGINTWIAPGGVWSDDAKWTLGRAPIPGDTVQLTQGLDYQVTLDVSPTIAQLTIGGTGDVISLDVGDQTLTITDTGTDPGLDILPLGSIPINNGMISVNRLANAGSLRSTGTASVIASVIANANNWRVATGTLTVSHPTSAEFQQTAGSIAVEPGATLTLGANSYLSYQGGTIVEAGAVSFSSGTSLYLYADLGIDGPQLVLNDAAVVAVDADRLTIGPTSTFSLISASTIAESNVKIVNQGSIYASGPGSFFNDSLYNEAGAVVEVDGVGAGSLVGTVGVDNSGTIELGGTAEARFGPGSSTGRFITNRASGSILVQAGAPRFLNGELVNQGTVTVNALTELARRTPQNAHVAAQHVNSGTINVLGGDLTVVEGGTSPTFTNQGTITVATPRSLIVSNASNATFTNAATGIIEGTGTVNVTGGSPTVTNLGTIAPGLSPGVLTWAGNLPLGASSVLDVELGGTTVGTEYDQLDASGFQITRSGIVNVTLIDGFQPADGDQFVIMQGLHTGQFTAVNLPTVPGVTLDTSSTLTTFVVTVTAALPPSPPGTETVWLGTADGDWTNPANWFDGNVPDDTMNTFIPAGTPFAPVIGIGADLDVDTLVVQDGASLGVDGALSVYGDLAAGTTSISGSGSLTLAGVSGTVSGTVPALTVAGNYTVTGDLTVNGDLLLEGNDSTAPEVPGTNLRINGNDVLVTGDFTTARFGRLHMLSAADTLEVQGNATFNGDETVNALTAGVLLVAGTFAQQGSIRSASFHPTGGHKTVLNGSATQTVSFENTALRLSTFGGLEITNAVGVTFATPITALGTITVTAPIAISMLQRLEADGGLTLDPGASLTTPYLQFGGTLDLEPANFTVDTVAVSNGSLPGGLPYVTVYVVGAGGELLGSTIVNDDLHVQADFNVNGQTLVVAGNLVVSGGSLARLVMASPDDSVVVEGDATFNGAVYTGVPGTGLEAGVLEVQGNFTQNGTVGPFPAGGNNFVASGSHITHFTGPNPEISFSHPDSSWFHHVIFATEESPVDLLTDASASGDLTLPPGFQGVDAPGFAMTVLGAVTAESEMTLAGLGVFGTLDADPALYAVETTIFGGPVAQTIPDSLPYQNVSVVSEAAFMGNTDVTGVLAVGGDPLANPVVLSVGPYAVNAFQLVVTGSGIVRMTDPGGELDIGGSALFDGFSTVGELTAGLLQVAGDFSQMSTNDLASFAASGTHVTELTGNAPQNVYFASPDTLQSHFGNLLIDNSNGLSFVTDAAVTGQLLSPTLANGVERTLTGTGTLVVRGLDADSLVFDGLALAVGEGAAISRFNAVRFENQDPAATQLFLHRKADDVTFAGLVFATTPTTGQYLHLVDEDGIAPAFTVTMTSTTPPSHGGFILLEQGAQLLGWPAEPPSQVLFSSSGGVPVGLFSVDADGANLFNLSASEGTLGFVNPRWAPDHARVTYTFAPVANSLLKVAAADGGAFASVVTDVAAYRPRYGLDGVRLAFECDIGGIDEICVVPDVSGPIALLNGAGDGDGRNVVSDAAETIDAVFTSGPAAFAWNPSVLDEIAFFRDTIDAVSGAAVSHLFRASYDGSTVNLYTPDGMDDGQGPLKVVGTIDWSVDGLIAFTAYPAGQSPFNTDLYVIQADGTGLKRLTAMSAVVGPVFSPDGSEILFAYTGDGAKIYRISSTGQPNDEVPIHFGYFNWFPLEDLGWDWSPDGTEIVLADPTYSDAELVIVKVKSTTTDATYTDDRVLIGRTGGAAAVIDRQPSWRP